MKRFIRIAVVLVILACLSALVFLPASAVSKNGNPQIVDYTGTLTQEELDEYEKKLTDLKNEFSYDAVIVLIDNATMEEFNIQSLETFADDIYDTCGYGVGENNDGILVLLRFGEPYSNHFHLCTTGSLIAPCTEADIDDMYYAVRPYLTSDDVKGAVERTVSAQRAFFKAMNAKGEKPPFNIVKNVLISLAVGFGVAFIAVSSMKSKLTSVRQKAAASDYVVPGSFNLRESRDLFLYASVSKTPRPQDTGSRGGGGAGFHVSSSGVSHGGGTR
ncbi:MAG: TPM domain-containing protein [Clostridia bacterium]|nr:TPM domain-containing protein [Clostridia bacterium]